MKKNIHKDFLSNTTVLDQYITNFDKDGKPFGNQDRNALKLFKLGRLTINIKSFKIPNLINQITYRFFRKSKAQRSFQYANKLIKLGVGTPQPIAYYTFESHFLFKKSFYVSKHLDYNLTYRELTTDLNFPDHENILRAFTQFTFRLHEKGIHFLDHSPGNTLIKINKRNYVFYLVDLNRMKFENMTFNRRIKNFAKLTTHKSMIKVMSNEYSKCINQSEDVIFNLMWRFTQTFQNKYHRKKRFKKKLLFWRSSR